MKEQSKDWIYRAVLIGLLGWAGSTLYSLDKTADLVELRLATLESDVGAIHEKIYAVEPVSLEFGVDYKGESNE